MSTFFVDDYLPVSQGDLSFIKSLPPVDISRWIFLVRMRWHFSECLRRCSSRTRKIEQLTSTVGSQGERRSEKMWKGHLIIWNTDRDGQWMARANSLSNESLGGTNWINLLNILHLIRIDTESLSLWSIDSSAPLSWSRWTGSFARALDLFSCLVDRIRQVHILYWQ